MIKSRHDYKRILEETYKLEPKHQVEVLRELCKTDLFFLLRYALNRPDIDHDWLFDRCREVQSNPNGHLDLWAREHYKSTIITFALTIQDILNNPNITIGIFSHTRPIAKAFLNQIKREFELNANLKSWFSDILYDNPQKQAVKWSADEGIIVKRTNNPKEATVEAWGVVDGQPISKHFDLLIYDDIVTKESVTTPDMISKTTDALALSYNLGADGGNIRAIGTRYHHNDTYRTIIDRGTFLPRIYAATDDGTETGNPVFLSTESLLKKRRDQGPYVFSSQMLQNPTADSSQGFKREWLRYYKTMPNIESCNWVLLIDPANGKRKDNDFTSIWAVGLGYDGNFYAIPEVRDRLNLTERTGRLFELHRKYRPKLVLYERYGMQSDIGHIQCVQDDTNYRFDIIEVAGPESKEYRIKRLVPLFENAKIYLPETQYRTNYEGKTEDLVNVFIEQEYMAFPVPLHDDMLDALARLCETEGKHFISGKAMEIKLDFPKEQIKKPNRYTGFRPSGNWMGV